MQVLLLTSEIINIRQPEEVKQLFLLRGLPVTDSLAARVLDSISAYLAGVPAETEAEYAVREGGRLLCRRFAEPRTALQIIVPDILPGEQAAEAEIIPCRKSPDTVLIPSGITRIEEFCFADNIMLKKVIIPDGVEEIPRGAFLGCTGLAEVVIPETVRRIGPLAFDGCVLLGSVALPALSSIGYGAFRNCTSLSEVTVPGGSIFPAERHIFAGCGRLDLSRLNISTAAAGVSAVFQELEDMLNCCARAFLDGSDSQHQFILEKIGRPEDEDILAETDLTDTDILWPERQPDGSIWVPKGFHSDEFTYIQDYLMVLLTDTFRLVNARLYTASKTGAAKYAERMRCFSLIDMRFIEAGACWYVLLADWSD